MTWPIVDRALAYPPFRQLRRSRLQRRANGVGHLDWAFPAEDEARWKEALGAADGKRVLIATSTGLHFGASRMDQVLAVALTMRGAKVDVLLCDEALPACMIGDGKWFPRPGLYARNGPQQDFCAACYEPAAAAWEKLGITPLKLSEQLGPEDRTAARRWAEDVGSSAEVLKRGPLAGHALAGALRFFASATLPKGPQAIAVLRSFLVAARLANLAAGALLDRNGYDVVVLHHGIYVPQGPILEAARRRSRRVVAWNVGYRTGCFLFSHGDSYHRTMLTEPAERWSDIAISPAWRDALGGYLHSRRHGEHDWIVFNRATQFSAGDYLARRGLDPNKPYILAMTNVAWDAQLHYPDNCFRSMEEWLLETVGWFQAHEDRQLVLRIHPGEVTGAPRAVETATEMLRRRFAELPRNVLVVDAAERVSSYALMEGSSAVIVYATKAGIEAAAMGKPVIVGGEAWIRGKGIAVDAKDPEHYRAILAEVSKARPSDADRRDIALRYAFHFFFRRMIPVGTARRQRGWPPYAFDTTHLAPYAPGGDPGLDVIATGILDGEPFEFPAERYAPGDLLPRRGAPAAPPSGALEPMRDEGG